MSDPSPDPTITRYQKKPQKFQNDMICTERKKQSNEHMNTLMDNNYTPPKLINNCKGVHGSTTGKYMEKNDNLLKQLDETEKKFVISQKNYAQIYRKYQKLRQAYEMLQVELDKERQQRLQELIDVENKFHLLEVENEKMVAKLASKEKMIGVLKEKLDQKQEQNLIFEQQLEQISKKLSQTMCLRERESQRMAQREFSINGQQNYRALELMRQKYQKQIAGFNISLGKFQTDLLEKEKEKRKVLEQMEVLGRRHGVEMKEIKDSLFRNEEQYRNWLEEAKQEKLSIIEKYQEELREVRKNQFMIKLTKQNSEIEQLNKNKQILKELQQKNIQLLNELVSIRLQKQNISKVNIQNQLKLITLTQQLKRIKNENSLISNQSQKIGNRLKLVEEHYENIKMVSNRKQLEVEEIKKKYQDGVNQNMRLGKQVENMKLEINRQRKQLINTKKQLNQVTDAQVNMNAVLTQATMKMKIKIQNLDQQLHTVTTELYAQRLQKAKIVQELQDTKIQMRRQYQLSLENTRQQLQEQIRENLRERNSIDSQKQKMYLEMFKLERQYELLKSQVVSADEMLKMGAKMHKYYQKRNK